MPVAERVKLGRNAKVLGPFEMLRELREMIASTNVTGALFRSNHASNYLPVPGQKIEDKERTRAALGLGILPHPGWSCLRPKSWRAL